MFEKSKSSGADEFIKIIRDKLLEEDNGNWNISRGDGCLHAKYLPTIKKIENKFGRGLITQIWLERLNDEGYGRCKFEVTKVISSKSKSESDLIREEIAGSIRSSFTTLNVLPKEIEIAKGSTVVAIKINWSKDRTDEHNKNEILKIIDFYRFLDEKLNEWNNGDSINLLNNNLEDKSVNANLKQRNGLIFESRLVESVPVSYKYFTVDHLIPNIMTKKITRPASLVRQGDLTLYATSLKVSDLLIHNFYSIERLDPENANEKGYQRLLNKGRAKKLTDYIVAGQETRDAFLPTSIFMATHKNISFNPANNTIDIDIDEVGPFNIVDGQHRVEGLKMAAEKDKRVLEFEVPVNIAINLSEIEQMCHFLIVNTTQKSVEEGVAQRIRARLTKAMGVDDTPNLPKWIFTSVQKGEDEKALSYVDYLNNDKESPWLNKVKMANDENRDGSINQQSFVKAIKKYVLVSNNPVYNTEPEDRQHKIFLNYWKALTNIIGVEEPTVLFKYNGVELFCKFCVPFYNIMVSMSDYKVSTMQSLLEKVFENAEGDGVGVGHSDFWVKGATASGLNTTALSKINTYLLKALYKPADVWNEKEMEI